jgi:uncharacterized protein (TIGR03083 family)
MAGSDETWRMIHGERRAMAETLAGFTPEQWSSPSLCAGWDVKTTAGHILAGAEQTWPHFLAGMARNGFRFNHMMDRNARELGAIEESEIVERLAARTATTNHPPAPVVAMLGEVVVHGADIRVPLGLPYRPGDDVVCACLDMYKDATFPVGAKARAKGLHLVATDCAWTTGSGPEVAGPAMSLLLMMTGRPEGLDDLTGAGTAVLRDRMATVAA